MALQHPEQELRFTRAAQSVPFWLITAVLGAAAITLLACSFYRNINPALPHPLWALLPLVPAWLSAKAAYRMIRHAYLILTPLGVEIFPLIRPQQGMRVVYWQEIDGMESNESQTCLTLHFDADKTGGIHLSLRPIPKARRELLVHALEQRISGGKEEKK